MPASAAALQSVHQPTFCRSVTSTLRLVHDSHLSPIVEVLEHLLVMPTRWTHPMFRTLNRVQYSNDFATNGRRAFLEHNARVRKLVPAERLLEYHVSEGWEPLCAFLGRELPADLKAAGTPRLNSTAAFNEEYQSLNVAMLKAQARRVLDVAAYAALVVVVGGFAGRRLGLRLPWAR